MQPLLGKEFFERHVAIVAQDLLGKTLVFGAYQGTIIETEAYRGADDPASHAARGPTRRAKGMFGPPGMSYVYFIYGMYHCLNVVCEPDGMPGGALIRGLQLTKPASFILNGPGKLCRSLGITLAHSAQDMTQRKDFCIQDAPPVQESTATPRIGITKNKAQLWRFIVP